MWPLSRTRSCGPLAGSAADLDGAAAVERGDAGGDAEAGVEVAGEGSGTGVEFEAGEQFEAELIRDGFGHRHEGGRTRAG